MYPITDIDEHIRLLNFFYALYFMDVYDEELRPKC